MGAGLVFSKEAALEGAPGDLDVMLVVRDMNDEEAGFDEVLFGCALRKADLPAFLVDLSRLVDAYGGADFSELAARDEDDAAIVAAQHRWFDDMAQDVVEGARLVMDKGRSC